LARPAPLSTATSPVLRRTPSTPPYAGCKARCTRVIASTYESCSTSTKRSTSSGTTTSYQRPTTRSTRNDIWTACFESATPSASRRSRA
jgi:hypothetical protein